MNNPMRRVIVIGCPGSGKSTFSRALHDRVGLPLYHLDMLFWKSDRTTVERGVFLTRLRSILARDAWIIDGDYASTLEERMEAADTVIFLDYPEALCLEGILARCGAWRPDMPWVEEEVDAELVAVVKSYREEKRPRVLSLLEKHRDKRIIVLASRDEAEAFLSSLSPKM